MQKPKRKISAMQNTPWTKSVQFVSDFSLQQCVSRLEKGQEYDAKTAQITYRPVTLKRDYTNHSASFTYQRDAGRNLSITADGYLKAMDEGQTAVYVQAKQSLSVYVMFGIGMVASSMPFLLTLPAFEPETALPVAFFLVMAFIFHVVMVRERNEMIHFVEDLLAPEERYDE